MKPTSKSKPDAPKSSQETESLVKRMAGPSSGKAGLAKDQTEINRIIVEASKGSKFYENEKKKDKELTVRIEKILKQRDEAIKGLDLEKIGLAVDQLIEQLEEQRDLSQIIVHVDMDAFFANVELLDDPSLKGKPFAVGGGVLSTASYEARKYGVRSGMAGFIAKKLCPDLILLKSHYGRYSEMSKKVFDVFHRYDPTMCPAGCDEGYLNITAYCKEHSLTPMECVQQMRAAVFAETQLTVSAGIAPNLMLAKICSDKNKPNGQFQLEFKAEAIRAFTYDLSIRKVPGIGRVNERLLDAIGIKTCGDIYKQRAVLSLMDKQFGLVFLLRTYLGIGSNIVEPHERDERKSIGAERTFSPLDNKDQILAKLQEVAAELEKDMEDRGWTGRTITLKFKLDTYQVFTRAKSVDHWVSKKEELYSIGKELLQPELPVRIRLIGLRATKLKDLREPEPANGIKRFFESANEKQGSNKKAKLESELNVHDAMEDSMPGFHEDDETDYRLEDNDLDADDVLRDDPSAVSSSSTIRPAAKPRSKAEMSTKVAVKTEEAPTQTCPICGKTLETDNNGLNAHVDFCLSRGAILEAQAETTKKPSSQYKGWAKPVSLKMESKPKSNVKRTNRK